MSAKVNNSIRLLDVVAITEDLPAEGLIRGQVGAVVELLGPETYEVEFSDENGRTYATASLPASQLILLHFRPARQAS